MEPPKTTVIGLAPSLRAKRSNPTCKGKKEWIAWSQSAPRNAVDGATSRDAVVTREDDFCNSKTAPLGQPWKAALPTISITCLRDILLPRGSHPGMDVVRRSIPDRIAG